MDIAKEMIMPNVYLSCIRTNKFKTSCLSINLLAPLHRESASKNALIPNVLRRGTATLPDMAAIFTTLDSLYGAKISPIVRKKGEIQVIGLFANFADEAFIFENEGILERISALMGEMLLMPNTHGGLLRREYVESERDKLLEKIRGRINDKRSYSIYRLFELMCAMEAYATDKDGTEEEAQSITATALTRHYHDVLSSSPLQIIYCGSAEFPRVREAVKKALTGIPRASKLEEPDLGTDLRMNSLETQPRVFNEEMQVTQGKLAIGFRLGPCMEDPNSAAIRVFNTMYGGGITSKLFMNVRERLSLCYYASSLVDLHKGVMAVTSGIEVSKYNDALAEIMKQLGALTDGDFSEHELLSAKRSVANYYRTTQDSYAALEDFYLSQALIGPDCSPAELAALCEEIKADEVIEIAKGVECDAIYFLHGPEEDN